MWSFRVEIGADGQAQVSELTGTVPAGVYQVSGSAGAPGDTHQHVVSIVQHDSAGQAVIGASGYGQ